jgi:hypothetical protein
MSYTDVFGANTVPPSGLGFSDFTFAVDTTLIWPYNSAGATAVAAKIMELTASVAGLSLTLPDASQVSVGEDLLFRNIGAETITIKDNTGNTVATLDASTAKFFYLTDNSGAAGNWSVLSYGSGASAVDAAALVGYGLTAIGSTLNGAHQVFETASGFTADASYRAKVVNFTGGNDTILLTSASILGNNFYFFLRNSGTGTLTVDPSGAETIDDASTLSVQPGESLLLVCSGSEWFSVGMGRSIQYNFTQLVKDVTSGTPFTLSSTEAANKLFQFIGTPPATVNIIVPNVVSVYYVLSNISTAQTINIKTATVGSATVAVTQGQKTIIICDGINIYPAQGATASAAVQFVDGSAASPSITFSSDNACGAYHYDPAGISGLGFTVGGALKGYVGTGGLYDASGNLWATRTWVTGTFGPNNLPSGSTTLWYSNTAPTGWTKITTSALDNCSLRIVSDGSASGGNGGVTGGTSTFAAVFNGTWSGNGYALTVTDMPSHNHGGAHTTGGQSASHTHGNGRADNLSSPYSGFNFPFAGNTTTYSSTGYASNDHTHSVTIASQGGGAAHSHTNTLNVRYASFILASKNAY